MKLFVPMLLLAATAALATPAQAQQATSRSTTASGAKPAVSRPAGNAQATSVEATADSKLTWQQRRAIRKKKLTPYAEAMLHNELLREEPAKKASAGLL